jgi:hypothetical protein
LSPVVEAVVLQSGDVIVEVEVEVEREVEVEA